DRIETHRKARIEVTVTDAAGEPVSGATVDVAMQEHAFNWGTAANGEKVVDDETSDGETYRRVLSERFNYSTVENRLRAFRWRNSAEDRSEARRMVEWLDDHGHDVRGHALFWESYEWMDVDPDQSAPAIHDAVKDRIEERAAPFEGRLADWDCQNHPFHRTAIREDVGKERVVEWWETAQAADTQASMGINEMNVLTRYDGAVGWDDDLVEWVGWLQDNGVAVDSIGCQSHAPVTTLTGIPDVLSRLDRFDEEFDLPVYVSEFHVPLWTEGDWADASQAKRDAQADYVRDFLTAAFSHPAVETVVVWNFWAGWAWRPSSCFYGRDWTLRPHGEEYVRLVFDEWWTETRGETGSEGGFETTGFLGEYEVSASDGDRSGAVETTLSAAGGTVEVTVD
ncbi:MAG: endo-1,4-beta-xylanase, partial [Haloarculaceae archaeon]